MEEVNKSVISLGLNKKDYYESEAGLFVAFCIAADISYI